MQNKLLSFGQFCRKFIVGEDWAATAICAWGIAITYAFSGNYHADAWIILPLVTVAGLVVSLRRGERQYAGQSLTTQPNFISDFGFLWVPMLFVTVVPLLVLQLLGRGVVQHVSLTLLVAAMFDLIFITTAAFYLSLWYAKQPLGSSLVGAVFAAFVALKLQAKVVHSSAQISHAHELALVAVYAVVLLAEAWFLYRRARS